MFLSSFPGYELRLPWSERENGTVLMFFSEKINFYSLWSLQANNINTKPMTYQYCLVTSKPQDTVNEALEWSTLPTKSLSEERSTCSNHQQHHTLPMFWGTVLQKEMSVMLRTENKPSQCLCTDHCLCCLQLHVLFQWKIFQTPLLNTFTWWKN